MDMGINGSFFNSAELPNRPWPLMSQLAMCVCVFHI